MTKVLILEARFYDHLADGLLAGAKEVLAEAGVNFEVITVPGIYELTSALSLVLKKAESDGVHDYDGYITLGTAIRGESDHYHYICQECMHGLNQLAVTHHLALGNGVLTVHNEEQALKRSDPKRKNMGGQAARACLSMLALKRRLGAFS
jgi:6,7-dimethyl-8-ribityllumazine synthase